MVFLIDKWTSAGEICNQSAQHLVQICDEGQTSEERSQKITGLSDLPFIGVPGSGRYSASGVATGLGAQVQAGSSRIQVFGTAFLTSIGFFLTHHSRD
jgi:hypothetical protein